MRINYAGMTTQMVPRRETSRSPLFRSDQIIKRCATAGAARNSVLPSNLFPKLVESFVQETLVQTFREAVR